MYTACTFGVMLREDVQWAYLGGDFPTISNSCAEINGNGAVKR